MAHHAREPREVRIAQVRQQRREREDAALARAAVGRAVLVDERQERLDVVAVARPAALAEHLDEAVDLVDLRRHRHGGVLHLAVIPHGGVVRLARAQVERGSVRGAIGDDFGVQLAAPLRVEAVERRFAIRDDGGGVWGGALVREIFLAVEVPPLVILGQDERRAGGHPRLQQDQEPRLRVDQVLQSLLLLHAVSPRPRLSWRKRTDAPRAREPDKGPPK